MSRHPDLPALDLRNFLPNFFSTQFVFVGAVSFAAAAAVFTSASVVLGVAGELFALSLVRLWSTFRSLW